MSNDEIIEMARQAQQESFVGDKGHWFKMELKDLERFAKLVEDKVTARYMQLFLDPENQPTQFGTATQEYREQEIKDEREACAKVAEDCRFQPHISLTSMPLQNGTAVGIANRIRARAQADRGEA